MEFKRKLHTWQDFKIGSVFSVKLCHFSFHPIAKAITDTTLIKKSQLINETMSHFLSFSTMSVCSLSWHVIPTSITVTSRFCLSQINNSGLLLRTLSRFLLQCPLQLFYFALTLEYWVVSYLLPSLKAQLIYYAQVQPSDQFIVF